jgi:guanine nucleotide-binding protein alpha-1 subunit
MESSENPFIATFKPPANETEEERTHRVRTFQDAQRISRQIDENLLETKKKLDKRSKGTRILLLGECSYTRLNTFSQSFRVQVKLNRAR